jgi:hypothetical protein
MQTTSARPQQHRDQQLVSAYCPNEFPEAFKARARYEDRTLSALLRRAMRLYLASVAPMTSESPAGQPSSRDNSGVEAAGNGCPAE